MKIFPTLPLKKIRKPGCLLLALFLFLAGAVYFIVSGAADEVLALFSGGRVVSLSSSSIRNAMPADKWVVAVIEGDIEDRIVLKREIMPDLVFYLDPLPAFYNYYVPVNDARWNITYSADRTEKGLVEYVEVSLPEIKFDDTATVVDISKLSFSSKNSKLTRLESTAEMLRSRLVSNVVESYNARGSSAESYIIARSMAEKTLADFAKARLSEHGVKVSDGARFIFNWIKDGEQIPPEIKADSAAE